MLLFTVLRSLALAILRYAGLVGVVCHCVVNYAPQRVGGCMVVAVGLAVAPLLSFRGSA